jgi:hypothetical protein
MNMIGHQHVCVNGALVAVPDLVEKGEVQGVIAFTAKTRSTIHTALDDVEREPSNSQAGMTRHDMKFPTMSVLTKQK